MSNTFKNFEPVLFLSLCQPGYVARRRSEKRRRGQAITLRSVSKFLLNGLIVARIEGVEIYSRYGKSMASLNLADIAKSPAGS